MKPPHLLPAALAFALLFTACEPQAPENLSPEAAAEFIEMSEGLKTF